MNWHVEYDAGRWKGVVGNYGDADVNVNGTLLFQMSWNVALFIMNTFFQHRGLHKYTWCRDSLDQGYPLIFVQFQLTLLRSVLYVRVKRGEELSTDHHQVLFSLEAVPDKPGGHGEQRCKKSLCWQQIIHVIIALGMYSGSGCCSKQL